MTDREAMKLALEALEDYEPNAAHKAITALRLAIEQAERQEPVAYVGGGTTFQDLEWADNPPQLENGTPLYTTPPAAQRRPLTSEWIVALAKEAGETTAPATDVETFEWVVRKVEAAHGIGEKK